MTLKSRIKRALRSVGYDVTRFHVESSDEAKLAAVLRHLQVDLVLDVGANVGQYAAALRQSGYRGRIVSFEPLSSAHAALERAAHAAGDPLWTVHERVAVGDVDGELTMHIAGNNVSSSALPMAALHEEAAPASRYIGEEKVASRRLDSVAAPYLVQGRRAFLKIDTQGFEARVLDGAPRTLDAAVGVQLEMSCVPLYEGQPLWPELLKALEQRGFVLWTLLPGFVDPRTGRSLQFDAVLVRE